MKSFVGTKVGRLNIIREIEPAIYKSGYKSRRYFCECDCGRSTNSRHGDIASGQSKSCGCLRHQQMSKHPIGRKEKGSSYLRYMYSYYRRNARVKDISFNLTLEQFKLLITGDCFYCGNKPREGRNQSNSRLKDVFYGVLARNGIDRQTPVCGYTEENTVSCCTVCNIAKHTMTETEFYVWLDRVQAHRAKRKVE